MPYRDRNEQKRAQHRSYLRNRDRILENQSENRKSVSARSKESRLQKRAKLVALKESAPCADCGVSYAAHIMDYDHVRGDKVGALSELLAANCGWKMIQEEIDKCDLVCSNCHRDRTFKRNRYTPI